MKDILKKYNVEPEKVINAHPIPKEDQYKSLLEEIPRRTDKFNPMTEKNCWHCGKYPRLVTPMKAIVWCERCYVLQFKRKDGSFIQIDKTIAVGKDIIEAEHNTNVTQFKYIDEK